MPNYDYECTTCGHQFEVFQRMTEAKLQDCPQEECDGAVRRLLGTGAGLIFKGSGFYETDYRSKSYNDGHKAEKKSAKSADSGGAKSADSGGAKSKEGGSKSKPEAKPSAPAGGS